MLPNVTGDRESFAFGALVENPELNSFGGGNDFRGNDGASEVTFDSKFLFSSEHGFIMTPKVIGEKNSPLQCMVPGTFGALEFPLRRFTQF